MTTSKTPFDKFFEALSYLAEYAKSDTVVHIDEDNDLFIDELRRMPYEAYEYLSSLGFFVCGGYAAYAELKLYEDEDE